MNTILWSCVGRAGICRTLLSLAAFAAAPAGDEQLRKQAQENYNQGNFKDAYEGFRKLALDPQNDPRLVDKDLSMAVQCLQRLNRVDEIDALLEDAVRVHEANWRL